MKKYKYLYICEDTRRPFVNVVSIHPNGEQTIIGKPPSYKFGVTNDIGKRLKWFDKKGHKMKVLYMWKSAGSYCWAIEWLLKHSELSSVFGHSFMSHNVEWFCDKADTVDAFNHYKCSFQRVVDFINEFLSSNKDRGCSFGGLKEDQLYSLSLIKQS